MITSKDIIQDGNETLRLVAKEVKTPVNRTTLSTLKKMIKYLEMSQDEKLSLKYDLKPGVGLAAPQINVSERFFAVVIPLQESTIKYGIINPEIIAESVEMVYLSCGEGCLSVPNKNGAVLRHKKIKIKGLFYDPSDKSLSQKVVTFSGYPAIVVQHEYDHLNGILFTDKITTNLDGYNAVD